MKVVSCADLRDAFRAGNVPEGAELEEHLRACESCAELFASGARVGRALGGSTAGPALDGDLWQAVEGAVNADVGPRAWLRSRPTRERVLLACVPALFAVLFAARKPRHDWAEYPLPAGIAWVAVFAGLTLASLLSALAPLGRARQPLALRVGLGLLALALPLAYAAGLFEPVANGVRTEHGAALWLRAAGCFSYGFTLTLPFVALLALLERGARMLSSGALLTGAAGGLVANTALLVHCALNDPWHLLLGHASISLILVLGFGALSARARAQR